MSNSQQEHRLLDSDRRYHTECRSVLEAIADEKQRDTDKFVATGGLQRMADEVGMT